MKRTILILGIALVVTAVLAGGAYFGVRMLRAPEPASTGGSGRTIQIVTDTGSGPVPMNVHFEPAPELPDRPAEVAGVFLRRQDNSLFVGTGAIELQVEVNNDERVAKLSSDGPEVEVVLTRDTIVYKETTEWSLSEEDTSKGGEKVIPQTVTRTELPEDLGGNIEMQVWGTKRGDRVTAEVVVYREVNEW